MRVFVAAWYYPPVTSSEGIVTYKLLRSSKHEYDVFSSKSEQWSYHTAFTDYEEPNITTYTIDTENIDEWAEACIEKFEELYSSRNYECIMTRSTPPESIVVGARIKQKHPEIKWIASLADPVANNPYEIKGIIDDNPLLNNLEKSGLKAALMSQTTEALGPYKKRDEPGIKLMCKLKEWETLAIENADLIISPTERQLSYLNGEGGWRDKYFALPHSYCADFFSEKETKKKRDPITFTYTGYSDEKRSLIPFVKAIYELKKSGSPAIEHVLLRFVGNTPRAVYDMVLNFRLQDIIQIEPSVNYYDSLKIMEESDWLLHVDASFEDLEPGGSIFFAGKIADYMGAARPILALTGEGSPACRIVKKYGGIVLDQNEVDKLADTIEDIYFESIVPNINEKYRLSYEATTVASRFDKKVDELCMKGFELKKKWNGAVEASTDKILTICVPSYNVQRYLDRCLSTLVSSRYVSYLDIIVVDDGSKDHTLDIAKKYEKHYPGVVRAVHKENGGHGSTINKAIDLAKGKYFRVVDSDDWIDSMEQDIILEKIKNENINVDLICANYHIVNLEKGTSLPIIQDCKVEYDKVINFDELDTDKVYFTMAGSVIKTSILQKMGMRMQENTFFVDVEFILFPVPYIDTVMFMNAFVYKYSQGSAEQSVYIPNMVKRYDHHDRVMRRVIDYRVKTKMTKAQQRYYDSILKRVLYTHYGLCTVYDIDKQRAYRQLSEFDTYLINNYPNMAKWAGQHIPVLKWARRYHYDYKAVKHSPGNLAMMAKQKAKGMAINNRALLIRVVKNKYTYRIATSKYFSEGKGLAIRNKIYTFVMK